MNQPKFLFVETNKRCNLRCNHCDFWKRNDDDSDSYLSLGALHDIFGGFKNLGGQKIVICGGEPMLDWQRYLDICAAGKDHGLRVLSVVNGTRIQTHAAARTLVWHGPHELSISFDDFREADHDYFRGVKNSFKMCVKAISLLRYHRHEAGLDDGGIRINVMGLIHGGNYLELPRFYDFVLKELRADKLKLNFLQPSFGTSGALGDEFFWKYSQIDEDRLRSVFAQSEHLFEFKYREAWKEAIFAYLRSVRGKPGHRLIKGWGSGYELEQDLCNSYERNIMLDHYGQAGWCFSDCAPRTPVKTGDDLRAFWETTEPARQELQVAGCKRLCGISHSVRREKCYE